MSEEDMPGDKISSTFPTPLWEASRAKLWVAFEEHEALKTFATEIQRNKAFYEAIRIIYFSWARFNMN